MPKPLTFETPSIAHGVRMGLFCGAWVLCGVRVLCGKEGDGFCGLGLGLELLLLKGWFWLKGRVF